MHSQKRKTKLIEHLTTKVVQSLGNAAPRGTELFVEQYCQGVTLADLERVALEDHCGAITSLIQLAQKRRPGWPELRLKNPSAAEDGWQTTHTVIEMINDDMPFLLDSVAGELGQREISIHLVVHPQMLVERGSEGELLGFCSPEPRPEGAILESFMHIEVDQLTGHPELVDLETTLRKVLADVRAVVDDWSSMRRSLKRILEQFDINPPPSPAAELDETRQFLRWVDNHHFTLLGAIEYTLTEEADGIHLRPEKQAGLGMLRKLPLDARAQADRPVPSPVLDFLNGEQLIRISKATRRSNVHRPVHIDRISVKRFSGDGRLIGEHELLGLFTSMAYSITAREIPLVRRKVERVIARAGFLPASHNAKGMRHVLEHYPRDELFQISEDDLYDFALRILDLQLRPRLALFVRHDEAERFVSCMVFVPRDQHNTLHRARMQSILESGFHGEVTAVYIWISDRPLAQLQFIVKTRPGQVPAVDQQRIEEELAKAVRLWSDRLKSALVHYFGEEGGIEAWRLYGNAFPPSYEEHFSIPSALEDIPILQQVSHSGRLGLRLYRRDGAAVSRFHLRTFEMAIPRRLSSILPMLENMGLEVDREIPFEVRPQGAANPIWLRDFELVAEDLEVDLETASENFKEALSRVWTGEAERDRFNRLVLRAGLSWREVIVLRAYSRYMRQIGIAFSQTYMANTLARNPRLARLLVELFFNTLDPAVENRGKRVAQASAEIRTALEDVQSLDEDRILRRFLNLIEATLRTNYFQKDKDGHPKSYLSLKLDCAAILELPEPRPRYEIFVYSPRVEAVHLRSGLVARGGIRWSDRREDFRTEILGLVKAQIVKNAVIVPVGAKGGFVVKQPPTGREELLQEGIECYKTMIRGMLDLTDNLQGSTVVPPSYLVRRDGDDPYLVVAADKGTASFSDIANQVAREYGFWLGDAFASGGSAGYDHKKMAITARGAWESVKRHFRELDHDIQQEDFTAVGVGDMSGDVFGNGMLLSPRTKLIAAFNHLHIFIDPKPDVEKSYAERQRLFDLPRSSWTDYAPELLSRGGAVYSRHVKALTVSEEARQLFELPGLEVTPNELIRATLKARVDLLWFGGIGTYVKASYESNADAGDRTNDELRVSGNELRCRVVGEGANLGLTQAGRVEHALEGGRLNTDFIDNSGGVDCSDHEVNIKIALTDAIACGELATDERDALLESMADQVATLVLRDNYQQSQSISLIAAQRSALCDEHARFIRELERAGKLDRRLAGLPDEATIHERRELGRGLTRPEISVLLAHAKMQVYDELLESDLPDEPQLVDDLVRYFPEPMQARFRPAIERHRLRREIIATHVTNSMVNRVGPTFVSRMAAETGRFVSDVARAYAAARDVFEIRVLWDAIEALDNMVAADVQIDMIRESMEFMERATRWFLRHGGRPLEVSKCVAEYRADVRLLAAELEDLAASKIRAKMRRHHRRLVERSVPEPLAKRVAGLRILSSTCDVVRCARSSKVPVERVARVYYALGERFGFDRLRKAASERIDGNTWHKRAASATIDDLFHHQAELALRIFETMDGKEKSLVTAWSRQHRGAVERIEQLLQDFDTVEVDVAVLAIAERELRRLAESADDPE